MNLYDRQTPVVPTKSLYVDKLIVCDYSDWYRLAICIFEWDYLDIIGVSKLKTF